MNACPDDTPWQRVINARGTISLGGAIGSKQRALLEEEGIVFDENGRVDFAAVGWKPDAAWLTARGYQLPPPLCQKRAPAKNSQLNLL